VRDRVKYTRVLDLRRNDTGDGALVGSSPTKGSCDRCDVSIGYISERSSYRCGEIGKRGVLPDAEGRTLLQVQVLPTVLVVLYWLQL
jgi:hypothetical protein